MSDQYDALGRACDRRAHATERPVRKPCKTCPWRVDQDASEIPNFRLELAERLERTTHTEIGAPIFACHQSRDGDEIVCAGWLARYGWDSISIRLMLLEKRLRPEELEPPEDIELEPDFESVIQKLRATTPEED
jgi:hypothetical protein